MKHLYLDESGDHNLLRIDGQYPVFVLGGVIFDGAAALDLAEQRVAAFKQRHLGSDRFVLHTADVVRNRNGFESLQDPRVRSGFLKELGRLVDGLDFTVVACAIRKPEYVARYGELAVDPYMLCLGVVVERFCFDIGRAPAVGCVVAERRGDRLDRQIDLAWSALRIGGTRYVRPGTIARRIKGFELRRKGPDNVGLELADLVVSPIGRHVLGKPPRPDWEVVARKLRKRPDGRTDGAGLVVLPREGGRGPLRSTRPHRAP